MPSTGQNLEIRLRRSLHRSLTLIMPNSYHGVLNRSLFLLDNAIRIEGASMKRVLFVIACAWSVLRAFAAEQAYMKDFEVCGYGTLRKGAVFPGNRGTQEPVDLYCMGAAYVTGMNMGTGQRSQQNQPLGFQYMLKAAEQGYVPAQAAVGTLYAAGTGVAQNFAEAAKWYRKAAEAGHVQAAANLAILYTKGQGVPRDPNQASEWNRAAAKGGSAIAEDNLYRQRRGPQPEPPDPADFEQGSKLYDAKNFTASFQACMKAAQAGNWFAETSVGLMYENGEGVQQNLPQAVAWYTKAANAGFRVAQAFLGNMYVQGKGVPVNNAEALKWYQKSAEQHYDGGYFGLARMYEYGFAVKADRQKAIDLYDEAGARGNSPGHFMAEYLRDPSHPDIPPYYTTGTPAASGTSDAARAIAGAVRVLQQQRQREISAGH
jgi:TPR repeat protein